MIVNGLTVMNTHTVPASGVTTRYCVRPSVIRHVMYVLNEDVFVLLLILYFRKDMKMIFFSFVVRKMTN